MLPLLTPLARQAFTKEQLDEICTNLNPNVWLNPHRSMLGLGNYDINVIMQALQLRNCEAAWFDKRKWVFVIVNAFNFKLTFN